MGGLYAADANARGRPFGKAALSGGFVATSAEDLGNEPTVVAVGCMRSTHLCQCPT